MKKILLGLIVGALTISTFAFAQQVNPMTENASFLKYKQGGTCIAGVCSLSSVKAYKEGGVAKQLGNYGPAQDGGMDNNGKPIIMQDKIKTAISSNQIIRKLISFGPGGFEFKGKKIGNFEVREFQGFSCGGGSFEQQVFDTKGKLQNNLKQSITLGGISYTSNANFYSNYSAIGFIHSLVTLKGIRLVSQPTIADLFAYQDNLIGKGTFTHRYTYYDQASSFNPQQSTAEKRKIEESIISNFNTNVKNKSLLFFKKPTKTELGHIPVHFYASDKNGLVYKYTINQEPLMKDAFAEFFTLQKFYISNKLDSKKIKNNQLIDFDTTKLILEQYIKNDQLAVLLGDNAQYNDLARISSLNQLSEYERLKLIKSYMPLFKVVEMGDYHVFIPNPGKFSLQVTAEMCKPLVYIYDKDSKSNSLTIHGIGLNFTKLIPSFNSLDNTYTWNYDLVDNKPVVDGKAFDYLYYSVKVPSYQFQQNAVYVPGSEMSLFFSDYLSYIGFNTQEQKDFITYRSERINNQKHYAVSIKYNEDLDTYVSLEFKTPYKAINRVLFEFKEIEGADLRNDWKGFDTHILEKSGIIRKLIRNPGNEVFERGGVYRDLYGKMSVY